MAICHGQGDPRTDPFLGGCCIVGRAEGTTLGQATDGICPNRWYIDWTTPDGEVFDASRVSLGTVDEVAISYVGNNPQRRQRVADQLQGTRYICLAAVAAIDVDPSILLDRAAFDAAWEATDEYQVVADHWELISEPRNYCMVYGPTEAQCCFREDQATNDARRGELNITSVTIRSQAQGAV